MGSCIPSLYGNLVRTFICIKLPQEHIEVLGRWLSEKRAVSSEMIRWVAPNTIHITLKFCGEIHQDMIKAMTGLLDKESLGGPLELSVGGIGGFPSLASPRVIWTGIRGDIDKLRKLQKKAESCACRCGVAKDWRKFSPHITLGRRNERGKLSQDIINAIEKDPISLPSWKISEIIMMKSELTRNGPIYTPMRRFNL